MASWVLDGVPGIVMIPHLDILSKKKCLIDCRCRVVCILQHEVATTERCVLYISGKERARE